MPVRRELHPAFQPLLSGGSCVRSPPDRLGDEGFQFGRGSFHTLSMPRAPAVTKGGSNG